MTSHISISPNVTNISCSFLMRQSQEASSARESRGSLSRMRKARESGSIMGGLCAPARPNAYYHDLLFYQGHETADELLWVGEDGPYRLETVGYGVANWYLVEGDTAGAVAILEEIAAHPWWPGYGRIAAEADLARLAGR